MKKVLKYLCLFVLCLTFTGCSNPKTIEEVKDIVSNNDYKTSVLYDLNRVVLWNKTNIQGWMYFGNTDSLIYVNNDINSSLFVDIEKNIAVDKNKETVLENVDNADIDELLKHNKEDMLNLDLNETEIKAYLKETHKLEMEKYNEMSSKEKLLIKFPNKNEEIENLSNEDADKYLKFSKEKTFATFTDLQEYVFLNDEDTPKEMLEYAKKFKKETDGKKLHLENFRQRTVDEIYGVSYDIVLESKNTNLDLNIMFDLDRKELIGINISGIPHSDIDSTTMLAICGMFVQMVDDKLSQTEILSMVIKSANAPILQNGWIYGMEIDDTFNFNILKYN